MAERVQDDVLVFEDYTEYNIAYPVIITRWEIKKVSGFNKQYLQVYFQKLANNVKAFQLNITSFSVFGKEVDNISERTIERVDEKAVEFSEMIPISNEAEKVALSVCQCLLLDGTAIKESTKRMVVNQFKPFDDEEDRAAAQRLLSTAKGYPIDNGNYHWFCACGALFYGETDKCDRCNKSKSEVFSLIRYERIQEERIELKKDFDAKQKKKIVVSSIVSGAVFLTLISLFLYIPYQIAAVDRWYSWFYGYWDTTLGVIGFNLLFLLSVVFAIGLSVVHVIGGRLLLRGGQSPYKNRLVEKIDEIVHNEKKFKKFELITIIVCFTVNIVNCIYGACFNCFNIFYIPLLLNLPCTIAYFVYDKVGGKKQ